ncbi:probable polygalacturonase At3g15720 [Olea europaea subsp. europaea]|uniref:endo-polygalacturonase n=2 Tax=Olea europaea subsp. europaea TaxID=158383 RepID=A0A8S0V5U9_OLEEU|nr:probable polygalacturonase At3g15720 [Olea europaea subsp. europaea]
MVDDTMEHLILLLILCMVTSALGATTSFNVMSYGAVGNGRADDSQAFVKAWKAVCQAKSTNPILYIPPKKTFKLKPLTFNGPCKSSRIYILVSGMIVAPRKTEWAGNQLHAWLIFANINGLIVSGKGTINGQGSSWWPQPCMNNAGGKCRGPTAITFRRCHGLRLSGLTHINSPAVHILITATNGALVSNLRIIAPGTSPNTDGIDVSSSTNVQIRNSFIGTGDDCIAISAGSSNINISGITCAPGHGISIGALGHGGYDVVENVRVRNCTLRNTLTGVRLKTWQGGKGYARKISFEGIKFVDVHHPVQIDQYYCPSRVNCQNFTSTVAISDISYTAITGTSLDEQVIDLSCSQSVGCTNIKLDRVYITSSTPGKKVYANCVNAHGKSSHTRPAVNCLLP